MKKISIAFLCFIATGFLVASSSCENDVENIETSSNQQIQSIGEVRIINGTAYINNKESLINMMKEYQKNGEYQKEFDNKIINFQQQGFRPLTPFFEKLSEKEMLEFVERKKARLDKRKIDFGYNDFQARTTSDGAIRLEDDIIFDPAYASILNEDREIVIGEIRYKYTEMGVFKVDDENDILLDTYLNGLTPDQRRNLIPTIPPTDLPCDNNNQVSSVALTPDIDLMQPPQLPPCLPTWTSPPAGNPAPPVVAPHQNRIKANLPICEGGEGSLWDVIFGKTKTCSSFFPNDRCLTTTFWNQNYLFFSSLGTKASFEKKVCASFLWMSTCWWEKSYPDEIELGVNSVKYEYALPVPMFNQGAFNYSTTFFTHNNVKYNMFGQVINVMPTGSGTFMLDSENNDKGILNMYVLGAHITDSHYNNAIDALAKQFISLLPPSSAAKNDLQNQLEQDKLKVLVVNSIPFDSKVTFLVTNVEWRSDSHRITHYFDWNFNITWTNNTSGMDYLGALSGATSYKNIEADIYGSAKYNGVIAGNRLKFK